MPYTQPSYLNTNHKKTQWRLLTTSEKMTFLAHHFWIEWGLEKAVRSEQDNYGETFNHSWKECFMRIYCMLPGRWGCTVLRSSKLIVLICWVFCVGRVFLCLLFPEGFRCLVYLPGSRDYLCPFSLLIIDGKDKIHPQISYPLLSFSWVRASEIDCQIHLQRCQHLQALWSLIYSENNDRKVGAELW